jgi:hypothetical protein
MFAPAFFFFRHARINVYGLLGRGVHDCQPIMM